MSLAEHFAGQLPADREFVVPYRFGDRGWFDYHPMATRLPAALWSVSEQAQDWQRLAEIRRRSGADWRTVVSLRDKEDAAHEPPWLAYLAGDNPGYPEAILGRSYAQACRRLEQIRHDDADLTAVHIHHWQDANPVTTEALVQLTTGAPQIIYNGGLLHCRVRYFDALRRRPGLPQDAAALVTAIRPGAMELHLVNTSASTERRLIIQAGGFGEHRFGTVRYAQRTSAYPGPISNGPAPEPHSRPCSLKVDDRYLQVVLPPATELQLTLDMERHAGTPGYHTPWGNTDVTG